eukprot:1535737-Rhodomonas_salina.1
MLKRELQLLLFITLSVTAFAPHFTTISSARFNWYGTAEVSSYSSQNKPASQGSELEGVRHEIQGVGIAAAIAGWQSPPFSVSSPSQVDVE